MGRFIVFLCGLLSLAPAMHGQGMALAGMAGGPRLTAYSFAGDGPEKKPKRTCTVTKIGCMSLGVGLAATITGIVLIFTERGDPGKYANQNTGGNQNVGDAVFGGGLGLLVAGTGMAIGGGVHDIVVHARYRRRQHGLSITAPGKHQAGIAYNF